MNTRFLETFIWLSRLKNFRLTAEKLHTTQPNISSRINSLESQLNTELYVRGSKDFTLTAAGRRLLTHAEKIMSMVDEMQEELGQLREGNTILRVGIIELVTLSWLPILVRKLRTSESCMEVDFTTDTSPKLISQLINDELDVVLIWGPCNEPQVKNEYLCNYQISWLSSPSLVESDKEIDVYDLARLPLVYGHKDSSGNAMITEYFHRYGLETLPQRQDRVTMDSYALATAVQIVKTGLGVMSLPTILFDDALKQGTVCQLPVKQNVPDLSLTACYKSSEEGASLHHFLALTGESVAEYGSTLAEDLFWH